MHGDCPQAALDFRPRLAGPVGSGASSRLLSAALTASEERSATSSLTGRAGVARGFYDSPKDIPVRLAM